MTAPKMTGREHWLEAERLLAGFETYGHPCYRKPGVLQRAEIHARLALSAPVYAFHQPPNGGVADSPNITLGKDEAPQAVTG